VIIIAKTKSKAIKQRRNFDKMIKAGLQTIIIDDSKKYPLNSEASGLRYNFRFYPKEIKLTAKDKIYTSKQADNIIKNYEKRTGRKGVKG